MTSDIDRRLRAVEDQVHSLLIRAGDETDGHDLARRPASAEIAQLREENAGLRAQRDGAEHAYAKLNSRYLALRFALRRAIDALRAAYDADTAALPAVEEASPDEPPIGCGTFKLADPAVRCSQCGRETTARRMVGQSCLMTQPNGSECAGIFRAVR